MTRWWNAGIRFFFLRTCPFLHPSLDGSKKRESFLGQELEQSNAMSRGRRETQGRIYFTSFRAPVSPHPS